MRFLLLIIFSSFLPYVLSSQFVEVWGTSGNEAVHGILTTSDEGYIIYGLTDGSGEGQEDFMLVKYNVEGELLWAYTYGTYGIENGHAVGLDEMPNGDLYLTGNWEEEPDDPDRGIITKLDSNGEIVWTRMLVGEGLYYRDGFHQVKQMPDGDLLAAGWSQSTTSGNQDPYLMKFTPDGEFIADLAFGGGYPDHSFEMELDAEGFYLAHTGTSLGPGERAAGLARLNYDLQLIWDKMYGLSGDESIGDVLLRPDGSFMLFGRSESFASERGFMSQVNAQGELLWTKTVNVGGGIERINDALLLSDGSYIISMSAESEDRVVVARFDQFNELQWAKMSSIGSSSSVTFRAENQVVDGSEIFCITDVEGIGAGGFDLEVNRYDPDFGPCDWEDIELEVQNVEFEEEDVDPEEAFGGSLIEFDLIRNDLLLDSTSLSNCFIDYCQFDGAIDLPGPCQGEEVSLVYELNESPPGTLTWEWQIGTESFETEEALYLADADGTIDISLVITAIDLPDCVQELDTFFQVIPIPEFNILGPELLCVGEIGVFEVDNVLGDVEWSNNEVGPLIEESFTADTELEVTMGIGDCNTSQTFQVTVIPYPTGAITAPELICLGDEITFDVNGTYDDLTWGNGNTEESITIVAGSDSTVSVIMANDFCTTEDLFDFLVLSPSMITTATDLTLCKGIAHQLSASGGEDYLWSNGSTGSQANFMIVSDTLVWVQGSNACGGETIEISIESVESSVNGLDTISLTAEFGEMLLIDLPDPDFFNVYDDSELICETCSDLFIEIQGDEVLTLVNINEFGCELVSFLFLHALPCTDVYIPNSFTPNHDGVNDSFGPVCQCACLDEYSLKIYDRGGRLVFSSVDPLQDWSGEGSVDSEFFTANAVYSYQMRYRMFGSTEIVEKVGSVTILR